VHHWDQVVSSVVTNWLTSSALTLSARSQHDPTVHVSASSPQDDAALFYNAQSTSKLQLLSTTHVIIAQATQFIRFYLSNYLHSKSEIYIFSHSKDKIYDKRPSTTF